MSEETWPVLDREERRVLGVLIEKQKTSEVYPMSLNAVATGCNQKNNRDPVLELSEPDVEDALDECMKKGLATKVIGGRVDKWKHLLYDAWIVGKVELAILAELLLRGPQTEGELRTRASRMERDGLGDLEALRAVLKPLVERKLVIYLTPEDRRGAVLTHGFHDPAELEALKRNPGHGGHSEPAPIRAAPSPQLESLVADLARRVQSLETEVARLTELSHKESQR